MGRQSNVIVIATHDLGLGFPRSSPASSGSGVGATTRIEDAGPSATLVGIDRSESSQWRLARWWGDRDPSGCDLVAPYQLDRGGRLAFIGGTTGGPLIESAEESGLPPDPSLGVAAGSEVS